MLAPVDVPLEDGEEPQAAPQDIQSAPVNSTAQVNLAPLSAPAALGEGGGVPAPQPVAAPTATPTQVVAPLDLAEPESALPETVSSADASSVAAPQGEEASFDSPIEDANEVSAPNQANAPQVGASPSSGPIDVAAPSELTPSLPTPVTGGAEPITSAAPPIGWEGEDTGEDEVEAFTIVVCSPGEACYEEPDDVDGEAERSENENDDATGENDDDEPIRIDIPDVSGEEINTFIDNSLKFYELNNGGISEAERIAIIQHIADKAASGEITPELVADINATLGSALASGNIGIPPLALGVLAIPAPGGQWSAPGENPFKGFGRGFVKGIGRVGVAGVVGCIFLCTTAGDPNEGRYVRTDSYLQGVLMTEAEGENEAFTGDNLTPEERAREAGEIAKHGWKHRSDRDGFITQGFNSEEEVKEYVEGVMNDPTFHGFREIVENGEVVGRDEIYWDGDRGNTIFANPDTDGSGSVYFPGNGVEYFHDQYDKRTR